MQHKIKTVIVGFVSILGLFAVATPVSAGSINDTETCNVQVYIKGTVPDSVVQGQSFNMTNFTVQPADTYGFNVTSSVYYLSATNTSSTTYTQDFYATNPSPTTGHNTYVGYYPNWTLNATGPVGSAVTIKLIKSVTVIQGYGGSPVTCNFSKTIASVPITAPAAPSPSPSPSSSPSTSPSSQPSSSPSSGGSKASPSASPSSSASPTPSPSSQSTAAEPGNAAQAAVSTGAAEPDEQSVSVIPLTIKVKDSSGKAVHGAYVTLDSSKKLLTDSSGDVVFSNVLTGTHAILVSYNTEKVITSISLNDTDAGKVHTVQLPAPKTVNPIAIGAGIVATGGIGGAAAFLFIQRKRQLAQAAAGEQSDVTIHHIIDGSAVPVQADTGIEQIPAIPAFEAQSAPAPTPAPWDPASVATVAPEATAPTPTPTPVLAEPVTAPEPVLPPAPASEPPSAPAVDQQAQPQTLKITPQT